MKVSGKTTIPWFTMSSPWPWFGAPSNKRTISVGNPQAVLQTRSQNLLGFSLTIGLQVGSNASGSTGGAARPATAGNILNLSAAQIASAPASSHWTGT